MAFLYSVYGLTVRSNLQIPGLVPLHSETQVDVDLTLGKFESGLHVWQDAWYVSPYINGDSPILTVWKSEDESEFRFLYSDNTEFRIDRTGTRVSATWPECSSLENTTTYLVGQIAAFVLRLQGFVCLHASSIIVDQRVLAIVGTTGAGKSTTAASFIKQGYPVLSEDVSTLVERHGRFFVQPGYPRVNLWPDAVNLLYGAPDALPRIVPTWDKRYLDLQDNGSCFFEHAVPLGGVYVLEGRVDKQSAPLIEDVSRREALISLLTNTHGRGLLEQEMRTQEFDFLSRVTDQVPLQKVIPHTDPSRLPQLCEKILHHFRNVRNGQAR